MTYATQQNLTDRFGATELIQLTDRANTGLIDVTVLNQALADADSQIDGFLAGRYALPLASMPKILVQTACDLARYNLYKDAVTELVQKRHDDAIKFLTLVGQGKISLGLDVALQLPPATGGPVNTPATRIFNKTNLADY